MLGLFDFLRRKVRKRTPRRQTGDVAEQAAERFLRKNGFRIIQRNVTYPRGEVDLVAVEKRSDALCFVEVRSRALADGRQPPISPEETVTLAKRRRIILAAQRFIRERRAANRIIRFDVIAVRFAGEDRATPDIRHYPGAFDARGRVI
jgi:putative endonuclease